MNPPSLHGNWVDLGIIVLLILYLFGWGRGFILGMIDLSGFILSFVAALRLYPIFGEILIANFSLDFY